jgi:hypothetical protein
MRLFLGSFAIWVFALASGAAWSSFAFGAPEEVASVILE